MNVVLERPSARDPQALVHWYRQNRRAYIEDFFTIVPKDPSRGKVPVRFTRVQEDYWNTRTPRDLYLKARQVTLSSGIEADYTSLAMLNPGVRVVVIVQKPEEKTVPHHMMKVQGFYHSVPEALRPRLLVENAFRMEFGFGEDGKDVDLKSTIDFISSGSFETPRGGTYHFVHITEYQSFEKGEVEALEAALGGLPLTSRIAKEGSPARAGSPTYRAWQTAKRREGAYACHLYPWYWEDDYRLPAGSLYVPPDWQGEFTPSEHEASLMLQHGLDLEQVRWRRYMVRGFESEFRERAEEVFLSEYLEDDVRCFLVAGMPALPLAVLDRASGGVKPPLQKAQMPRGQDYGGALRMWLPPEPGESYVIMADPAEGLLQGHDSAAVCRRVRDWAHCFSLLGKISPGHLGGILADLGRLYNQALIGWERNNHGWGVRQKVVDLGYRDIYLNRETQNPDGQEGFPTNRWTKGDLVTRMAEFMGAGYWGTWDAELVRQYRELQRLDKEGEYNTGELDLAMADMLCLVARGQARRRSSRSLEVVQYVQPW